MEKVTTWIAARPQLVIPGLIDSTQYECHLTLAFLGDADPAAVKAKLEDPAIGYYPHHVGWPQEPLVCEATGTAEWVIPDSRRFQVIIVQPSIPAVGRSIYDERERIKTKLEFASGDNDHEVYKVNDAFPFIPHITMPFRAPTRDKSGLPILDTRRMFIIDKLYVCFSNPDYIEQDGQNNGVPSHINWEIGKEIPVKDVPF